MVRRVCPCIVSRLQKSTGHPLGPKKRGSPATSGVHEDHAPRSFAALWQRAGGEWVETRWPSRGADQSLRARAQTLTGRRMDSSPGVSKEHLGAKAPDRWKVFSGRLYGVQTVTRTHRKRSWLLSRFGRHARARPPSKGSDRNIRGGPPTATGRRSESS
jgi:hypothetical protein